MFTGAFHCEFRGSRGSSLEKVNVMDIILNERSGACFCGLNVYQISICQNLRCMHWVDISILLETFRF